MRNKHTEGQWKMVLWNDKRGFNIFTADSFIASVHLESPPHTMRETQANARLIATAPELLEALKEAENTIRFLSNHLAGRMATGALFNMKTKADDWAEVIAKAEVK